VRDHGRVRNNARARAAAARRIDVRRVPRADVPPGSDYRPEEGARVVGTLEGGRAKVEGDARIIILGLSSDAARHPVAGEAEDED